MNVRFFDPGRGYRAIKKEIDSEINRVLTSGKLILQEDVEKFEENLANFVGTKYAVGVNSGTDALFLSIYLLKKRGEFENGDEIITTGHTFHATVEAIYHNGLKPVLVDVGEDGMIDVDKVLKAITNKTKVVIPVHLMGDMVNLKALDNVGWTDDIGIIEDACQALGSEMNGGKAGSIGLTGCFSFYPAKILGAYGDAGAITTNSESLAKELKDMRNHYKYNPGKYGFNSRLDNLQAAILNVKIKYLPLFLKARQEVANVYDEVLKDLPIKLPTKREGRVYQDYIIRTDKREQLTQYLKEQGIETMRNNYHFPNELPKPEGTIKLENETLRLPCNPDLTKQEVEYVAEKVRAFYETI